MSAVRYAGLIALSLSAAACSTLSGGGPSVSAIRKLPDVELVPVTPESAANVRADTGANQQAMLGHALAMLRAPVAHQDFRFAAGDTVDITVWSYSGLPGGYAASNPGALQLGTFTIASDGAVILPYAGRITLAGLTLADAQRAIAGRYASLKIYKVRPRP